MDQAIILNLPCFVYLLMSFRPKLSQVTLTKMVLSAQKAHQDSEQQSIKNLIEKLNGYIVKNKQAKDIWQHIYIKGSDLHNAITLGKPVDCKSPFVSALNELGQTPAHIAAIYGRLITFQSLIAVKPELLYAEDINGDSPLHLAVRYNHSNIVEECKQLSGIHDLINHENQTLAHMAAKYGRINIFTALLSTHPSYIKARDIRGRTLVHIAAQYGQVDILKYFPKDQALKEEDDRGYTPFAMAVVYKQTAAVKFFIEQKINFLGAEYDLTYGCTIMHSAAGWNSVPILELLSKSCSELINKESLRGWLPIEIAIQYGAVEAFEFLIKNSKVTSLFLVHEVVNYGKPEMIDVLVEHKFDLNCLNAKKITPLQEAVKLKKVEMVQKLLENKADVNFCSDGKSALDYAVEDGNFKIIELLLNAGANADQYLQSTDITPVIAFIFLQKLKIYINNEPQDGLSPQAKRKVELIDEMNVHNYPNWEKCLEDMITQAPTSGAAPSFFGLPRKLVAEDKFIFSSLDELRKLLAMPSSLSLGIKKVI